MIRLTPFSRSDIGLASLMLIGVIGLWFIGDFHTLHDGDSILYPLISLYRWTVFAWDYDHIGTLLPLLASPVQSPYWNLLTVSFLCSFLLLAGLALWLTLLTEAPLVESSVWVCLLLPLVIAKEPIFQNAAHLFTFGPALFFSGLFAFALRRYLQTGRLAAGAGLFVFSFLAVYLSKNAIVPLAVVAGGLVWNEAQLKDRKGLMSARFILPLLAPPFALLLYQLIEWQIPLRNDLGFDPANLPMALPALLKNWSEQQLTHPLLAVIGLACLLHQLLTRRKDNPLLVYFTAGVALEMLVVASTRWVERNIYHGHYLTDLNFLAPLAILVFTIDLTRRITSTLERASLLVTAALTALVVNALAWNSFSPTSPFTQLDRTIGANTNAIVEAECDLLLGDYWKVWPAVLAANDYYYRHNIIDPRTGQTRLLAGVTYRAWPTESLWRPRFGWPDAKLCSFADDDEGVASAIRIYAPDIVLLMSPKDQIGPIVVSQLENRRLPSLGFEFDNVAPGPGWHGQEVTPDGQTFQWMKERAELVLPLATDHDLALSFRVRPALAPGILPGLTLAVNDHPVPLISHTHTNGDTTFEAAIPKTLLDNPRYTQLVFQVSRTVIPDELYGNGDTRALGLAFDWLRVAPAVATAQP
jgi:hypothetical protein